MPSPFPGMDPYLEGTLWPDLHHRLASALGDQLEATISDRYVVRIEVSTREEAASLEELSILFPDLSVRSRDERPPSELTRGGMLTIPAPITVPVVLPLRHRIPSIHIVLAEGGTLVTAIEIMSPANKRSPGIAEFREKWTRLHRSGVHLVDIDLIRRGTRIYGYPELQAPAYLVAVTRGGTNATEAWPVGLGDVLPVFPVPLMEPDSDAAIDLQAIFERIYEKARYASSLDYSGPPPPPALSVEDREWARERIAASGILSR